MIRQIHRYFLDGFDRACTRQNGAQRRVGAELKFPLVALDGETARFETVCALWQHLSALGWEPIVDELTGCVVGATKPGEKNSTVASCETGFSKTEFSLAHVADLCDLHESIRELRRELRPFSNAHSVRFLGYGIQPGTPPSQRLLMMKSRASVWDQVFRSNSHIPEEDGHDLHLFTINAASHVHVSVSEEEAVPAVNVLNGFAGAQIALTANSNIWKGRIDSRYKCVAEKFWDWWPPAVGRVGIPQRPFEDLEDYVRIIAAFRPVYVTRLGKPILLSRYPTFEEYYRTGRAVGRDLDGREISFVPERADIDLHWTCYWYNARISRYYTVENRANDQQPSDGLTSIAALTLGLVSALPEASEELSRYDWRDLRAAREEACQHGLEGWVGSASLSELAGRMLDIARIGLKRRGIGEERFLSLLERRLREQKCPADEAAQLFKKGGIEALVADRAI